MAVWIFSPGPSQEASLAPSLIWPGRSGLQACAPPPSTATEVLGPPLVTRDSGVAEAGAGLRVEGRTQGMSPYRLYNLAPCGLWAAWGGPGGRIYTGTRDGEEGTHLVLP